MVGLLLVDVYLWRAGYGDFPTYLVDDEIGYIPKPSQAGVFAHQYPWYFNRHSMRNEPFVSDPESGILVLGDSIVFGGGIDYQPEERLGSCLAILAPEYRVWSASAGSWSFLNELAYLRRNQDVVDGVQCIIWVLNSGDLSTRSLWSSESSHPTHKPAWLALFLATKWARSNGIIPPSDGWAQAEAVGVETRSALLELPEEIKNKSIFVLFPNKEETEYMRRGQVPKLYSEIQSILLETGVPCVSLPADWAENDDYRDGIHPSPAGNIRLAHQLSRILREVKTGSTSDLVKRE